MVNYYEVLQIDPELSIEEIDSIILKLQKKWMNRVNAPDFNHRQEAERMVKLLDDAHGTLCDFQKRRDYDRQFNNNVDSEQHHKKSDDLDYLDLYKKDRFLVFQKEMEESIRTKNYSKADKILKTALEKCPDHPGVYYLNGYLYYYSDCCSKAIYFFNQAVYYDAGKADYWCYLGMTQYKLNDLNAAEKALEKAYSINQKHFQTLVARSYLMLKTNRLDEAISLAEEAKSQDNHNFEIARLISKCYLKSNEPPEKVLDALKEARKLGNDNELDFEIAKMMYMCGYHKECMDYCKKIVVKNPNSEPADRARELIGKIKNVSVSKSAGRKVENIPTNQKSGRDTKSLDEAMQKIHDLIGMEPVKEEIEKIVKLIEFEKKRRSILGLPDEQSLCYHFMFTGNPGTGKTTVARLIGDIFYYLGLLKEGHLVEVDRSKLVGQYIGQTAILTQEAVKNSIGGVLFVDEAYALARGDSGNDFGREAIETLLKAMEDQRGAFTVILAGYTNEMRELMKMNPGLKSRINMEINFQNYNDDELLQIGESIAGKSYYNLTAQAEQAFMERISRENIDEHFANARTVRNLIEEAIREKAYRMAGRQVTKDQLSELEPIDFGIKEFSEKEDIMKEAIDELESMIGLREVKDKIYEVKDYIMMELKRKEAGLKTKPIVLHMQFLGNPGTGKTTVARIVGKIFKAMGVLKRGHMIEVSRVDLVGSYIGQTAPKTLNKVKEAYGGVLFIDEAYSICQGSDNDFGHEAISTLIKEMEDSKDKLMVILAGYPKEMERLLNVNPGMKDRIRFNINFPDYVPEDMLQIFASMCERNDYMVDKKAEQKLFEIFKTLYENRDRSFGNGRLVDKFFETVRITQAKRINRQNIGGEGLKLILDEDIAFAYELF
jgi:SpoVK/Ycf46/Vps4 family AAA+-type ATPase